MAQVFWYAKKLADILKKIWLRVSGRKIGLNSRFFAATRSGSRCANGQELRVFEADHANGSVVLRSGILHP